MNTNFIPIVTADADAEPDIDTTQIAENTVEPSHQTMKDQAHSVVSQLFQKYATDEYMLSRTYNYICYQMPNTLDNMKRSYDERTQRMDDLISAQNLFIHSFMSNNQYYYVNATEKFFYYDGLHYSVISEDDIMYNVMTEIRKNKYLLCWKQRTTNSIMKRIKENTLIKSVPESDTIQHVINMLHPILFETRAHAKYFLCILGDNILKKHNDLTHFIDTKAKSFIREINTLSLTLFGVQCIQSIKHKYHEHDYTNCRLVKINDAVKSENIWLSIIANSTIDILCVACHYSTRYQNSDNYIINASNEESLMNEVFFMKNTTQSDLVDMFVHDYLQIPQNLTPSSTPTPMIEGATIRAAHITWKDMQYLWKQFIEIKCLPSVIFQQTLKTIITQKLYKYYNSQYDTFIGIFCKHLPVIRRFMEFWDETMTYDENDQLNGYEIAEVCYLYKTWLATKLEHTRQVNDKQLLDLIGYFYPHIEIEKDKYIYKIRSTLWDKQLDVQMGLESMKQMLQIKYGWDTMNVERAHTAIPRTMSPSVLAASNITIYDAYVYYCKYVSELYKSNEKIVSKSYFEKYVLENLEEYVIDSKYISMEWVLS